MENLVPISRLITRKLHNKGIQLYVWGKGKPYKFPVKNVWNWLIEESDYRKLGMPLLSVFYGD
jgi:hypothetical protein